MPLFLDTNVVVYAFDGSDTDKQATARRLLDDPAADFVTSAQVLSEFYVVVTRKLSPPVAPEDARMALAELSKIPVVAIDERLVTEAAGLSEREDVSLWDAQILVAAARSGCEEVLTEDLSDGQSIVGVTVRNPFG